MKIGKIRELDYDSLTPLLLIAITFLISAKFVNYGFRNRVH